MEENQIFPVNEVSGIQQLADILGGEIGCFPSVYPWEPKANLKSSEIEFWKDVKKRLARWKSLYISLGGRLVMINLVLDVLPTHLTSCFPLPSYVKERLDNLGRNFLWHGNGERKRIHQVQWET